MRKFGKTGAAAGFLFVTSAVLLPAGTAVAAPDPALAGDCAQTLGADSGQALTVDAGAAVNQPHLLTVGTGTPAAADPAVNVDVTPLTHQVRADQIPGVTPLCDGVQDTVNALSATTQVLLGGIPAVGPPAAPPAPAPSPSPPSPEPPASGGSASLPGNVSFAFFPLNPTSPSEAAEPSDVVELLPPQSLVAPHVTSGLPPSGTNPGPDAQESGTALALPMPPDRLQQLPLLLAAAILSVVGSLLAHTWLTRRPD